MPVANYSVLRGDPVAGKVAQGSSPHYLITVQAAGQAFTVAVNIQSTDGSEVLYAIKPGFTPPDANGLGALPQGITALATSPGGPALDYIREQVNGAPMIQRSEMTLLAPTGNGKSLSDAVVALLNQAIADANGEIFAFGSAFADSGVTDGIHNIHMNQGNPRGQFEKDNGTWQDGALFVHLPAQNDWTAVFLAFQTESWQTDDSGNPVAGS